MKRGLFITGTDTGVGKTYIAAGIAATLRNRMVDVGVMKPVETGCRMREGNLVPSDVMRLLRASAVSDTLDLVNPYRFAKPLAPYVAARLEDKTISISRVMRTFEVLSSRHEFMIVEGAGGIMVPLTRRETYLDLAQNMGLPALIVARPGLGTINHTLLTIAALRAKKVPIAGVVINYSRDQVVGPAEKTNPAAIEKISRVRVLASISFNSRDFYSIIASLK